MRSYTKCRCSSSNFAQADVHSHVLFTGRVDKRLHSNYHLRAKTSHASTLSHETPNITTSLSVIVDLGVSPDRRTLFQPTVMTHQADAKRALDERGYQGLLIHGDNPLKLVEKAVRDRITESYYWKEQCFGLNAATLLDRAVELTSVGGTFGIAQKPTPFLCLAFKMLQITPEREIIEFYLQQGGEEFKYLRVLAAFYVRLTWEKDEDIHNTLEPYLSDYRKLRVRNKDGWRLTYVDQFVDDLLMKSRICSTSLPKILPRLVLEDLDRLEPRVSPLGEELEELDHDSVGVMNGGCEGEEANGTADRNGHSSEGEV